MTPCRRPGARNCSSCPRGREPIDPQSCDGHTGRIMLDTEATPSASHRTSSIRANDKACPVDVFAILTQANSDTRRRFRQQPHDPRAP